MTEEEHCRPPGKRGGIHVLVVEDNAAAREATGHYLRYRGHSVATAAGFDDALQQAGLQCPDALVCDWQLGGDRDGVDVARALRGRCNMAIILLTAHPLEGLRYAARDIGHVDYLRKPVDLNMLADVVESASAG